FLLVLPGTTLEGAAILAERCRQRLADCVITDEDGRRIPVTASFGLACSENLAEPGADAATADRLIRHADAALYRAKAGGRNRVELQGEALPMSAAG
ncbi:MAG: hypothetical protein K0S16_2266, partial [Moraxellaceae bacterium]|nr:hypothetical protein [Moraxellaceae bacterium]